MRKLVSRTVLTIASAAGLSLVLAGCSASDEAAPAPTFGVTSTPTTPAAAHWSYEGEDGPDHWGELSGDYELCETGTQQSPIDLTETATTSEDNFVLEYATIDEHVVDTGHTFQLAPDDEAGVSFNGKDYSLVQMHFHDPSEHTVDGEAAPVEFHFVNTTEAGELLVVGVLGVEGAENRAYDLFIDATASAASDEASGTVDLAAMLPAETEHFAYPGSLTTPPCSEGVQWIVMQTPVELSAQQIADLQNAYDHNSRPVQPLGDRSIESATAEVTD
jgi:carbonic anhydrase